MSDLKLVLEQIRAKDKPNTWTRQFVENIIADGRIGVLPTRSELESLEWTTIHGDSDEIYHHVDSGAIDEMIRCGMAIPDPDPPAASVPSIRYQIARVLYSSEKPTFNWDSLAGQSQHQRMGEMANALLAEFDITPKAVEAANGGGAK